MYNNQPVRAYRQIYVFICHIWKIREIWRYTIKILKKKKNTEKRPAPVLSILKIWDELHLMWGGLQLSHIWKHSNKMWLAIFYEYWPEISLSFYNKYLSYKGYVL